MRKCVALDESDFFYLMICLVWIVVLSSVQRHKLKFNCLLLGENKNTFVCFSLRSFILFTYHTNNLPRTNSKHMRTQILNNVQNY